MINLLGIEGTDEYQAAAAIAAALKAYWPGLDTSPEDEELVVIAANTKISGYSVSDLDVVLAAKLGRSRFFIPPKSMRDDNGKLVQRAKVQVSSLVAAIEVKSQPEDGVRIVNDDVEVRYKDGWKSATEQNIKQVHSLKAYLDDQWIKAWVFRCVVLQGIQSLPRVKGTERPEAGAVPLGFNAPQLIAAIAGVDGLNHWKGRFSTRRSCDPEQMEKVLGSSIFKPVVPSNLDRARMVRVAARPEEAKRLAALIGTTRIHLAGHGGTGKTVLALQAAHEAFEQHGKRTLITTYNHALAADITRLLALMGIPGGSEGGGVEVRTTMSVIYSWLYRLGVTSAEEAEGYEAYDRLCGEAIEMIQTGAMTRADIDAIIDQNPERFDFDAVIVDEAQDTPQAEADLLALLFGAEKICLADGREQLLRGQPTNWRSVATKAERKEHRRLGRCLRMKRNLGTFANAVAERAGLNWKVEPNDEAAGGRIYLLKGRFSEARGFRRELEERALQGGNKLIDLLYCVPPSDVVEQAGHRRSKLGLALEHDGHEVWDAVELSTRRDFPRSADCCRVVQYESCRGLEGWVTVLEGFDEFWRLSRLNAQSVSGQVGENPLSSMSPDLQAWLKAMIPLTRPIDTLVIALDDTESPTAEMLLGIARDHPDYVTLIEE